MIYALGSLNSSALSDTLLNRCVIPFRFWSKIAISFSFFDETIRSGPMFRGVSGLKNDLFVVVETDPGETFNNRAGRFFG